MSPTRGDLRADRDRDVPAEPVVQRRVAADHGVRLRPRALASRSTNGGLTWSELVTVIRDTAPTVFNDKQSITADPTDAIATCTRSGTGSSSPGASARASASFRTSSFSWACLVRPVCGCGHLVGAGAADLRPGSARPDDRQPDRRPTERDAGRHLHRVQQREREEEAWRLHPRPPVDRQGHDLVKPFDVGRLGTTGTSTRRRGIRSEPATSLPRSQSTRRRRPRVAGSTRSADASPNRGQADAVAFSQSLDGGLTWSSAVKVNKADRDSDRQPAGVHAVGGRPART